MIKEKYKIDRFKVIPNPVSHQVNSANLNSQRIINVGRFGDQKNQFELVEIFDNVRNKESWELVFFGDGAKKEKTLEMISSLQLKKNVQVKQRTARWSLWIRLPDGGNHDATHDGTPKTQKS